MDHLNCSPSQLAVSFLCICVVLSIACLHTKVISPCVNVSEDEGDDVFNIPVSEPKVSPSISRTRVWSVWCVNVAYANSALRSVTWTVWLGLMYIEQYFSLITTCRGGNLKWCRSYTVTTLAKPKTSGMVLTVKMFIITSNLGFEHKIEDHGMPEKRNSCSPCT